MTDNTTPTTAPPPAGPPQPRRLTKSASDKKVAGVAAGIAEYFGIDPTIVRLVFLASIFLGGFGLIAYLIAWIVLPTDDGSNTSAAPHTLASTSSTLVAVGLLIAGAIVAAATIDNPFGGSFLVPLLLVGAGAFLLLQPPDTGSSPAPESPAGPESSRAPTPLTPSSPGSALAVPPPAAVPATATTAAVEVVSPSTSAASAPPPPPKPAAPPEPTPPITALVLSAMALIGATGFLVHAAGWADVSPTVVIAWCLAAIGGGLVAAAFLGGGRWLIPLGILTTFVLMVSAVVSPAFDDGIGDREYRPETLADVRDEYRLGIGDLRVDLRDVSFPDGEYEIDVHLGIGELAVVVPDDVQVDVTSSLDIGELEVFGEVQDGIGNDIEFSDVDVDSEVVLVLDVDAGIGHVTVRSERGGNS